MAFMDKLKSGIDKAKETASIYGETMKDFTGAATSKGNFQTKMNNMRQSLMEFYASDNFIIDGNVEKVYRNVLEAVGKGSSFKLIDKDETVHKMTIVISKVGLNPYSATFKLSFNKIDDNKILIEMDIDTGKDDKLGKITKDNRNYSYIKSLKDFSELISAVVYGTSLYPKTDEVLSECVDDFGTEFDEEVISFGSKFYSDYYIIGLWFNRTQWFASDVEDKYYNTKIGFSQREADEKSLFYYNYFEDYILVSDKYIQIRARECSSRLFTTVKIPIKNIRSLVFVKKEESTYELLLNGKVLFVTYKVFSEGELDKINIFFNKVFSKQFYITDDEVHDFIKKQLDPKVMNKIQSYFYEDEYFKYLATGLDSISARDYILCTNQRIVLINRELFGLGENIKSYEYMDITSISTKKSDDLLGAALNSAFKQSSLEVVVAGSKEDINNITNLEANRIIEIYNQCRRAEKQAEKTVVINNQSPSQVVVPQTDLVEQIKKLSELKDMGILTEEEFNTKKNELLAKI